MTAKIIVTKLGPSRYLGVKEAADKLRVSRQTIYMFASGYERCLGEKKRARLVVVDRSRARSRK